MFSFIPLAPGMNWGALHKIGRFRNVPTVGTFVNEFNFNLLINVPTVGTFRKRPILCNAPLKVLSTNETGLALLRLPRRVISVCLF